MKAELISKSLKDTENFAKDVLNWLQREENKEINTVCLYGNLGAGKTAFSQVVGKLLGVKENMQSPTFVIQKFYETNDKNFKRLVHIDAYRIEESEEMISLRFQNLLDEKNILILIEWPEKIKNILPEKTLDIYFEFVDENTRKITANI